jgi:GNAT superfamily N-acetyltransferase
MMELSWRDQPRPEDRAAVRELAEGSGVFPPEEIEIAVELVEERIRRGLAESGYHFLFAEPSAGGPPPGYACYGPIPLTRASWDLYWIVVARPAQGRGLGRRLLAEVERRAGIAGAAALYVDTSGRPDYGPTRAFYSRCGYATAAELPDFYAPGDAKVIFAKRFREAPLR